MHADGQVEARLTFASADQLGGLTLDRDGDGAVTTEDVAAARDDLRAFFLQGVEVDADGSPCAPSFREASLTEVDGLLIVGSYACPSDSADIEVTLYYLSAAPRGQPGAASYTRRGIARIEAEGRTIQGVLSGDRRALALQREGKARTGRGGPRNGVRGVVLVAAAVVVGLLAYGSRRWRAARAAWQNRSL